MIDVGSAWLWGGATGDSNDIFFSHVPWPSRAKKVQVSPWPSSVRLLKPRWRIDGALSPVITLVVAMEC
jgi:hypothetical protein